MLNANSNDRNCFFNTLVCHANTCVGTLSFFTNKKKKWYEWANVATADQCGLDWMKSFFSLFFFSLSLCLFVVILFFYVLFFGISFFFLRSFQLLECLAYKEDQSLSWPPLPFFFLCFSFIHILKFEHDMKWHKSRSTSKEMNDVR